MDFNTRFIDSIERKGSVIVRPGVASRDMYFEINGNDINILRLYNNTIDNVLIALDVELIQQHPYKYLFFNRETISGSLYQFLGIEVKLF